MQEFLFYVSIGAGFEKNQLTPKQLLGLCGNFVELDSELDCFRFAHLSVREYFESQTKYANQVTDRRACETCISVYSHMVQSSKKTAGKEVTDSPSNIDDRRYAATWWPNHFALLTEDERKDLLTPVVSVFIKPEQNRWSRDVAFWSSKNEKLRFYFEGEGRSYGSVRTMCSNSEPNILLICCVFGLTDLLDAVCAPLGLDWKIYNDHDEHAVVLAINFQQFGIIEHMLRLVHNDDDRAQIVTEALNRAAVLGDADAIQAMLDIGADPNSVWRGRSILRAAVLSGDTESVRILIDNEVSINLRDNRRDHVVIKAIASGDHEMIRLILGTGLIQGAMETFSRSLIHEAAAAHDSEILTAIIVLLESHDVHFPFDTSAEDLPGCVNEVALCRRVDPEKVCEFVGFCHRPSQQIPDVFISASSHYEEVSSDTNSDSESDSNSSYDSSSSGDTPFQYPDEYLDSVKITEPTSLSGADHFPADSGGPRSEEQDSDAESVAIHGALVKQARAASEAQGHGSSTESQDGDEVRVPLTDFEESTGLHSLYVQAPLTINRKELANMRTGNWWTPLHMCLLGRAKWGPKERTKRKGVLETAATLVRYGASVTAIDDHGSTPLHYAAAREEEGLIEFLVKEGAKVDAVDNWGRTPLHIAVLHGKTQRAKELIKFGSDIDAVSLRGNTPLHVAVLRRHSEILGLLLYIGADWAGRSERDKTPLDLAMKNGNRWAVEALVKAKCSMDVLAMDKDLGFDHDTDEPEAGQDLSDESSDESD